MAKQKQRRDAQRVSCRRQRRLAPSRHTIAKQGAAALALGLGLAAGAPAEASIAYTPINTTIQGSTFDFLSYSGDFHFQIYHNSPYALVKGLQPTSYMVFDAYGYAAFLKTGEKIDAGSNFNPPGYYGELGSIFSGVKSGNWPGQGTGYLGLKFTGADGVHFGWAKLEVPEDVSFVNLYGYAFESNVDTSILAGAGDPAVPLPNSLLLLASGAAGLLAFRRSVRSE